MDVMVMVGRIMVLMGAAMGAATLAGLFLLDRHRVAWAVTLVLFSLLVAAAEVVYLIWNHRAAMGTGDASARVLVVLAVASAPGFVLGALCADMFLRSMWR